MAELVTWTVADGLAHIILARPEAGNAMSWDLVAAFGEATAAVAADGTVRAVLITAQGKHFCVGGDIRSFASEADPSSFIEKLAGALHVSLKRLAAMDAPVVIAIQGAAAGAGLSLAAFGDIVLAGAGASFSMAYTGIGLTADGGATWTLPRLVGLRRAQELAFLNRRLSAEEAERIGLVTMVVADDRLADEALALGQRLASGPTRAFGAIKRLFASGQNADFADHLDAEATAIGEALRTRDAQEAVRAFLDRATPEFQGR